jgi:urease accessory protein
MGRDCCHYSQPCNGLAIGAVRTCFLSWQLAPEVYTIFYSLSFASTFWGGKLVNRQAYWLAPIAAALLPVPADAHISLTHVSGFVNGLVHPITGIDHILAMTTVGLLASARGGRALWLVPAAFLATMIAGACAGVMHVKIPYVETGIALSLVVFGMLYLTRMRPALSLLCAIVGCFAFFHGYAHGAMVPATIQGLAFGVGFVITTLLLQVSGIAVGMALRDRPLFRIAVGGAVSVVGVVLALAL